MTARLAYAVVSGILLAGALGPQAARAQANESAAPSFEFSNSAAAFQGFGMPRRGRHVTMAKNDIAAGPTVTPASRTFVTVPVSTPSGATGLSAVEPAHAFDQFFVSGIADLVRGDPAAAADVFEVTRAIATGMPQMNYLLALARVLSDFDHRERALPLIREARAADPDHALYAILNVLADASLSQLKGDGALYLTTIGAQQLHAAAAKLPAQRDAYNGRYVVELLGGVQPTGNAQAPERFVNFAAFLGQGRRIVLPDAGPPQALGRLLVLSIPPEQMARYNAHVMAGAAPKREALSQAPSGHFSVLLP